MAIGNDGAYLYKLNSRIKVIENAFMRLDSDKRGACVKNRNEVSTKEIRQDFEAAAKQMGRKGDSKPLQVFCVSSWAFVQLAKRLNLSLDFESFQTLVFPLFTVGSLKLLWELGIIMQNHFLKAW